MPNSSFRAKLARFWLALVALTFVFAVTPAHSQEGTITLRIRVIDSAKRIGIPGAKVWLRNGFWPGSEERAAFAYADQSGQASITVRRESAADTHFYASAAGYK